VLFNTCFPEQGINVKDGAKHGHCGGSYIYSAAAIRLRRALWTIAPATTSSIEPAGELLITLGSRARHYDRLARSSSSLKRA